MKGYKIIIGILFLCLFLFSQSCNERTNEDKVKVWIERVCCQSDNSKVSFKRIKYSSHELIIEVCESRKNTSLTGTLEFKSTSSMHFTVLETIFLSPNDTTVVIKKNPLKDSFKKEFGLGRYKLYLVMNDQCGEIEFEAQANGVISIKKLNCAIKCSDDPTDS